MLKWARKGWFTREDMPVQHSELKCWVPLWFLLQMDDMQSGGSGVGGWARGWGCGGVGDFRK
jgi:hypothetical protein